MAESASQDAVRSDAPRVMHLNTARTWRGGERQVFFLAQGLARRGITQWVVGRPGSEIEARCTAAGLPFRAVSMGGEWDLPAALRLRRLARELGVNILHAHTARAHGLGLFACRGLPHTRLVVSRRVDFPANPNIFSRYKYRTPRVAAFIAISENVRRILIQDGVPAERIGLAYSGVDLTRFVDPPDAAARLAEVRRRLRAELELDDDVFVIGNVAALVDHKDHRTLLAAAAHLKSRATRPFRVLIFGEGELRRDLERLRDELGVGDVLRFGGFRDDVDDLYRIFDLFAMSSKEEGLGTAVLDAMARGLAVFATNAGGLPEMIVDGAGGTLTPAGDGAAFGAALASLMENDALRARYGAFNRERVQRFSHDATCESTLAIYKQVLAR